MNENLQNTVNGALEALINDITQVKNFAIEQIPDVLHQFLLFQLTRSILIIMISITIIILSYLWFTKWSDQKRNDSGEYSPSKFVAWLIGGVASMLSGMILMEEIINVLKIIIAPKIYLIEYAVRIIK